MRKKHIVEANEEIDRAMDLLGPSANINPDELNVGKVDAKTAQEDADASLEEAMDKFDFIRRGNIPENETAEERKERYEEYIRSLKEKASNSSEGMDALTTSEKVLLKMNDTAQKKQIIESKEKIRENQEYIENAFTDENIEREIANMRRGGSKGKMTAAKQEILANIMRAKKKKDAMNKEGRIETEEDVDIASVADEQVELQSHIIDVLRLAAIKNSGVDMETLIAEAGITKADGALYDDMKKQLSTYLTEARKSEVASAYSTGRAYNASDDAMSKALKKATISTLGAKRQGKRNRNSREKTIEEMSDEELFGKK